MKILINGRPHDIDKTDGQLMTYSELLEFAKLPNEGLYTITYFGRHPMGMVFSGTVTPEDSMTPIPGLNFNIVKTDSA